MKALVRESARQGPAGYAADEVAWIAPWGFGMADVRQLVHIWCGDLDEQVGRAHADYLAASIPRSSLVAFAGAGHLFPISHWGEMLAALL